MLAQNIPDNVVAGGSSDPAAIDKLVNDHKAGLTGDAAAIKRSRNAITEPLTRSGVNASAAFRNALAGAVRPVIQPLVSDARDEVAINAIRIAGALGNKDGFDLLVAGLKDKRTAVRVMAAMEFGRIADSVVNGNGTLTQFTYEGYLDELNKALGAETDPFVLAAMFSSLESTMKIPAASVGGVADKAFNMTATAVSAKAKAGNLSVAQLKALGDGARSLYRTLTEPGATGALAPKAAGVVREMLPAIDKQLAGVNDADRETVGDAADKCKSLAAVAMQRSNNKLSKDYPLKQLIVGKDDAGFKREAANLTAELAVIR